MKPLKLTMTAFGPYKDKEVIDFTQLKDHHLFVISGNTGAGKTTIFDGICFALYGSASGSDRDDSEMLRSDFAEDDTHTAVELVFSLHGRTYRILRQLGHVKEGNKTKTGEKYEFFEIKDGEEIPCVDRQMVTEINKKAEQLIGLSQDQFKQIVMLPQGEFRKLLTSKTENKEAILRRLFKTENYKQLNELLKQRRDTAQEAFNEKSREITLYIDRIKEALPLREGSELTVVLDQEHQQPKQVITALEQERKHYEQQVATNEKKYEQAYKEHNEWNEAFHKAKTVNAQFAEWDQKANELSGMEQRLETIKNSEKQLERAELAVGIEAYEQQAKQRRKEESELIEASKQAEEQLKLAKEQLETAQKLYEEEAEKQQEREEISRKLDQLTEFVPAVSDLKNRKQQLENLNKRVKQAEQEREALQTKLVKKQQAHELENEKIRKAELETEKHYELDRKLQHMREQAKVMQSYLKLQQNQGQLEKELEKRQAAFVEVEKRYNQTENIWLSNQAAVLAGHLHEGEACPVCGSLEHPNKALHTTNDVTKEELDQMRTEVNEKQAAFQEIRAKVGTNQQELTEKEAELKAYNLSGENAREAFAVLVEEGKELGKEVDRLGKLREEVKQRKSQFEVAARELKEMEANKEKIDLAFHEQNTAFKAEKAVYEERLQQIPEQLQDLTVLEKQLKETNEEKEKLEKAWEAAQKRLQQVKESVAKAVVNAENRAEQVTAIQERRKEADEQFKEAMTDKGFTSEEAYHEAKVPEEKRKEWKTEIEQYYQQVNTLKQRIAELEQELKDKQRIDLQTMQQQLDEWKQKYEEELQKWNDSKEKLQLTVDLRMKIFAASEEAVAFEEQFALIDDLHNVMRGQNDQKISFERYLQIEYLEQIIHAANERLIKLSNGQFKLERSERQEAHGRQSGLGLDIYDAYTGQTRDVKTLSGGEKFNASLSLALGMSDVIQSFQGNISIETMFIDEGFGSLDEESLTKAIDTLIELQQTGRMIGVISHVQELKNMLPARLEVVKQKEGHSKTKFVVT